MSEQNQHPYTVEIFGQPGSPELTPAQEAYSGGVIGGETETTHQPSTSEQVLGGHVLGALEPVQGSERPQPNSEETVAGQVFDGGVIRTSPENTPDD